MHLYCRGILTLALALAAGLPAGAQLQASRTIIMIGPPGSGKTVQSEALRKKYKIPSISMTQLLRLELDRNSPMGQALAASFESGELLGDGFANDLIMTRLLQPDVGKGFILDGYPATEDQAKTLDQWLSEHKLPSPAVVILNVPEAVSRERLTRRKRANDKPDNIERRLRDYQEVGRLVEQWYGTGRIVRVDGTGTPAEVTLRITEGIDDLKPAKSFKVRSTPE